MIDFRDAQRKWRYDKRRTKETEAMCRPITPRQIDYIVRLSRRSPSVYQEVKAAINHSDLYSWTVGEAMFAIKCFLGEIKPDIDGIDGEGI